jgi:single-strand DNA-binding protein
MSDLNRVFLMGNLTGDPVMKEIGNGRTVTDFSIALNRVWNGSDGETKKDVAFVDCSIFGRKAEIVNEYFSKGRKIFVEGRLKLDKWKDKNTQKNMQKIMVIVEEFHFVDSKKIENEVGATQSYDDSNIENFDSV